jgi:hypothetical protein
MYVEAKSNTTRRFGMCVNACKDAGFVVKHECGGLVALEDCGVETVAGMDAGEGAERVAVDG